MRSKRSEVKVVDVQSAEKINGKMSCFETVTESMQFAEAACKSHQEWRMKIYLNGQRRVSKLWHHPLLGYMAHTNFNKKVMAIPQTHVKILPLYSLITLQNLVTVVEMKGRVNGGGFGNRLGTSVEFWTRWTGSGGEF